MRAIETDRARIKELSEALAEETWAFYRYLKESDLSPEEIDAVVHRLYREISAQIECSTCLNCCKQLSPCLDADELEKLAGALGMAPPEFVAAYLVEDDESNGFVVKGRPCPFLTDAGCSLGAHRPGDCASYPHLEQDGFVFRLMTVIANCAICPIVFNVYEALKDALWHTGPLDDLYRVGDGEEAP
jgi:Fe-S-cluster containining protein